MALNANALIDVAYAQSFGATGTTAQLEEYINAVSQEFENYCSRVFRSLRAVTGAPGAGQVPLEWYQGTGTQYLRLLRYPITAIERIRINEVAITVEETTEINKHTGLLAEGFLFRKAGWPRTCSRFNDLTGDPDPSSGHYTIDVAYTGGLTAIPSNLKLACLAEVLSLDGQGPGGGGRIKSERTPGGHAVTYAVDSASFDPKTLRVLNGYRRIDE